MKNYNTYFKYYNKVFKKVSSYRVSFNIPDGFDSLKELTFEIKKIGLNPKKFSYIKFNNMYYAVRVALIISKEFVYFRESRGIGFKIVDIEDAREYLEKIKSDKNYTIKFPKEIQFKPYVLKYIKSIDPQIDVVRERISQGRCNEDLIIFATAFITSTYYPYEINCVCRCFKKEYRRHFNELALKSVVKYNPFNDKVSLICKMVGEETKVEFSEKYYIESKIRDYTKECVAKGFYVDPQDSSFFIR